MPETARAYRMRKRQEDIAQTRQKIVEAAVDLHGSVGPAHTTFSAVAERAGVQRSTVYRHFPDEATLFGACTSHWLAANPWPRAEDWRKTPAGADRLGAGLRELYGYFERSEQMLANAFRDLAVMPPFVGEMMRAQIAALQEALVEGWEAPLASRLMAFATDFRTWQALRDAGLSPAEAASTMTEMVSTAS
jgi:AcrR family transcriptional regulator